MSSVQILKSILLTAATDGLCKKCFTERISEVILCGTLFGIHSGGDEHICLQVWQVEWWCLLLCASGPLYSKIGYEEKPLAATPVSCNTQNSCPSLGSRILCVKQVT